MDPIEPEFARLPDAVIQKMTYGAPLAGRGRRLVAWFIDVVIVFLVLVLIQRLRGVLPMKGPLSASERAVTAAIAFGTWLVFNSFYLANFGQTIGKRALGIQMVRPSGQRGSLLRLALLRQLPVAAASQIPVVGPFAGLADAIFIIGPEKRCLHDFLANTVVVETQ